MWWNILPPFFIIAASLAMPQFIAPLSNWLLVGNFYRRSLLDPDLTKQYLRDTRLTGNPYILTNLEDVPEDDEEPELTEEQLADAEYQRCKAIVDERELREAQDRATKCPKPETDDSEIAQEQDTCKRREMIKKKRMQKRKAVPVVEKVDKKEKCKSDEEKQDLCNVGPVCPPCPPVENNNQGVVVAEVITEDDVYDKKKKCDKKGAAGKDHEDSKDSEVSGILVPVGTEPENGDRKKCPKRDEIRTGDNVVVVTDSGSKKCKSKLSSAAVVHVPQETSPEVSGKCPKKADGNENEHSDVGAVVGGKHKAKKCAKKDEGNLVGGAGVTDDDPKNKKCSKKE